VGAHTIDYHPVFFDGTNYGEGKASQACSITTTSGNQNVKLSGMASTGAAGFDIYVDGFLSAVSGPSYCTTIPQVTTSTAMISHGTCGNSEPGYPGKGPVGMNYAGLWAPTAPVGTNSTQLATTAYVDNAQMPFAMNTHPIVSGSSSNIPGTAIFGPVITAIAYVLPTNGANGTSCASQLQFGTNPAATWTGTLYRIPSGNGTPVAVGTIQVSTSGRQTWKVTQTTFSQGDSIALIGPSKVDSAVANPVMSLCVIK
jgi:hypothetical protein